MAARLADPAMLGLFNGIGLVTGYVPFLNLGALNGLNRELPYYIGRGEKERALDLAATAKAWSIIVGGFVAAVLCIIAIWYCIAGKWDLAGGWFTYAVGVWVLFYGQMFLQVLYRTHGDFARLSIINVIQNTCSLIFVVFISLFGFYGLCIRSVLVALVLLGLTWWWRPLKVPALWNTQNFIHLLKVGAPIFVVGQLYAWWIVLDSTLALKYVGAQGFGFYQLAIIAGQAMEIIPSALGQILYPRMAQEYGRTGCIVELIRLSYKQVLYFTAAGIPLLIAAWFAIPPVSHFLLPKYTAGVEAAQWMVAAVSILFFAPFNNIFNVVRRQDLYFCAITSGIIVYGITLWTLTRNTVYLAAFPQAMLAGRLVFVVAGLVCIAFLVNHEKKTIATI